MIQRADKDTPSQVIQRADKDTTERRLTGNVPQLQADEGVSVPVEHLEGKVHADLKVKVKVDRQAVQRTLTSYYTTTTTTIIITKNFNRPQFPW